MIPSISGQYSKGLKSNTFVKKLWAQKELQLIIWIGLGILVIFKLLPLYGLQLAFKSFDFAEGIWGSKWIGLEHFKEFVNSPYFGIVMLNTISISLLKIVFTFPIPIVFAILLNEMPMKRFRHLTQNISYLPHFLSWVVCYGVVSIIFSADNGVLNVILLNLGIIKEPVMFIGEQSLFWPLLIVTENWKEMGWAAIIYVAAIAGVDEQIYESSTIDGATRFQKIIHITLPCILPTIIILLILKMGSILDAGFDQIFVFKNPMVGDAAYIIDTYVYDIGMSQGRFDYATAIGMFKSIISFFMIWGSNKIARRSGQGLW